MCWRQLAGRRLAIVTNCSQDSPRSRLEATGGHFEVVMSAERAGVYKTDPRAYQAALDALGLPAGAGAVRGRLGPRRARAGALGMPVYWSNRQRLPVPAGRRRPLVNAPDLDRASRRLLGMPVHRI